MPSGLPNRFSMVNTFGTGTIEDQRIAEMILETFSLTPAGMIQAFKLRRPIYRKTAAFGHFGRTEETFSWEATDKAEDLRAASQMAAAVSGLAVRRANKNTISRNVRSGRAAFRRIR